MQGTPELIVFYNTKCPVCDAGINMQKNRLLQAVKAGIVEFRDINLEPDALMRFGSTVEDVRRRLHALERRGELLRGADVAVAIWRLTPGQDWLAALTGNRIVLPVSRFVYDRFADVLFAWNRRKGRF
jgi:predicted DCC family thiol-disulfide oxidoreductase YuxK